jgi:hypothetical protein
MATEQLANNPHDTRSLAARVVNFYRFFNKQDWLRCYEYIDPSLRAKGSVGPDSYSDTLHAFFRAYGPIRDLKIVSLRVHSGSQARNDPRDFAYVVISWKDRFNGFHHFRERWIKDRDKWFTRVVGLVPHSTESS